jgi:hypothetical protein
VALVVLVALAGLGSRGGHDDPLDIQAQNGSSTRRVRGSGNENESTIAGGKVPPGFCGFRVFWSPTFFRRVCLVFMVCLGFYFCFFFFLFFFCLSSVCFPSRIGMERERSATHSLDQINLAKDGHDKDGAISTGTSGASRQ